MGKVDSMSKYETISQVMEKAMSRVLPIPKTPRVWHPPPPHKTVSWVPHGTIGNSFYEQRLEDFAHEILAIDAMKTRQIKYGSRGWGYLLEGLGKITKDEFDSCQHAINDCRKLGLLPIDFVKEDQDETRRFAGITQAVNPASHLTGILTDIDNFRRTLAESATDFWKNEKYYVMMCVEKGDIKELFVPICRECHVPIVSSKGWAPILLRAHIATLSKKAEERNLTPVVLLFYDHDPAGLKITDTFRKNLKDCEKGTGWNPCNLTIDRFGLNAEDIEKYGLTWIDNLKTSSGKGADAPDYVMRFGRRKCEVNALFKNDDTLKAAEEICRNAIGKYYGAGAKERFKRKEEATKSKLSEIYDNPVWSQFSNSLSCLIKSYSEKETKQTEASEYKSEETIVFVDNKYYGHCPRCHVSFNYSKEDVERLVRCRRCNLPMRLKWKEEPSQ